MIYTKTVASKISLYKLVEMILKTDTDKQQKLEKFRKNKDESFTVKTSEDLPVRFALAVCYSNDTRKLILLLYLRRLFR